MHGTCASTQAMKGDAACVPTPILPTGHPVIEVQRGKHAPRTATHPCSAR